MMQMPSESEVKLKMKKREDGLRLVPDIYLTGHPRQIFEPWVPIGGTATQGMCVAM